MASGNDVIDADVAEALKQLKRGFRESEQASAGAALAPAKPRPPPPPWEPVKIPRTSSNVPKAPAQQLPKVPGQQPHMPRAAGPMVGPNMNPMGRSQGGAMGNMGGLRNLQGQTPYGGGQVGGGGASGAGAVGGCGGAPSSVAAAVAAVSGPGKNQVQLDIPQSSVGLLIGKQATTINAIKVFSRAHCFVDQHSPQDEKARVTIVGTPSEVEKCKRAVEGLVDGSMSTSMLFQLAGLPAPAGVGSAPGARPAGPGPPALLSPTPATTAAYSATPSVNAAVPNAAATGLPVMPANTPAMPGKGPNMLANTMALSANTPGAMPMDNYLNEYYARCWSQYGHMTQRSEDNAEQAAPEQAAPAAFDKAALARLAEQAALREEQEQHQQEMEIIPPAPPPAPAETVHSSYPMQQSVDPVASYGQDSGMMGGQQPPMQLKGDLAERASTEVRHLLGDLLPSTAPSETVAPVAPTMPGLPAPATYGARQPEPHDAPVSKPTPHVPFTGFTLQSTTPQAQKDNASVQKMLQRLQGNMQQTKQTIAVQQVHTPPHMGNQPGNQVTGMMGQLEQKGLVDPEWEALDHRVHNARTPEEIADVGRAVLKKFPSLAPEQIAELLGKMGGLIGQYHGDFLAELSRMLSTRLKQLSSTQFAFLMSTFLAWSTDTRERFAEFSKGFFDAACMEMPSRLMELAPHELNCCLAAFMSLGFVEHKFFTGVGRSALARHKTFGPTQLAALLTILSEMRLVHVDLFNASSQVISMRVRELRPLDILRTLRAFAKCSMPNDLLCQAIGDEVTNRYKDKGANCGFRCEDICEIAWMMCVLQAYHENIFRLMFKLLEDVPRVSTDALCQLYECHLVLDTDHKKEYAKYRMDADIANAVLDHYKENRKDARRCSERIRSDVTSVLKSLVEGIVHSNHRTSTGLLVDVAALRKRSSTDGYIHIDIDSSLTLIRPLDQDDSLHASFVLDGSVALRRRILQKHDLRLVTVRESDWRSLDDTKEKRRHLRSLLASLGDVLE